MQYTQTQLIAAAVGGENAPMSLAQIISEEIRQFQRSRSYDELVKAHSYYCNRTDIQSKRNDIENRANTKIEHPIYRRIVDQKVRYLLSRPWSISTADAAYTKALEMLLDDTFRRKIRRLGKHAIRDGIGWMQPYINERGELSFSILPAHEVIPLWTNEQREGLSGFIRLYRATVYQGREKTQINCAEYWDCSGVRRFEDAAGGGDYIETTTHPQPHFMLGEQGYNWKNVPLVWLRYNDEQLPLLRFVKDLIDDYNWQTSITADVLRDVAKFVYVLRNYGGEDLGQFVTELRKSLAIQVEGDGGVDTLKAEVNVDGVLAFLDKQRRDLYDFASAVDTKDPQLGTASGKAIAFRYMDLDADCADLGAELQTTFARLKPFVDTWLQATGGGDFSKSALEIQFNMDLPVDETEIIANINASAALLSKRTLLENHPWVRDVEREIQQGDDIAQ